MKSKTFVIKDECVDAIIDDVGTKLLLRKGSIIKPCDKSFFSKDIFIQDYRRIAHKFHNVENNTVMVDIVFSNLESAAQFVLADMEATGEEWKEITE